MLQLRVILANTPLDLLFLGCGNATLEYALSETAQHRRIIQVVRVIFHVGFIARGVRPLFLLFVVVFGVVLSSQALVKDTRRLPLLRKKHFILLGRFA